MKKESEKLEEILKSLEEKHVTPEIYQMIQEFLSNEHRLAVLREKKTADEMDFVGVDGINYPKESERIKEVQEELKTGDLTEKGYHYLIEMLENEKRLRSLAEKGASEQEKFVKGK